MENNNFDELPDKKLLEQLIENEKDPASIHYKRVLDYPKIRWIVILLNIFGFIIALDLLAMALWFLTENALVSFLVPLSVGIVYLFIRLSSILIFFVECYQLLAPTKTRMKWWSSPGWGCPA